MPDVFNAAGLLQGGAVGLLAVVFILLLRALISGSIRTEREVLEIRADRDARLADKDRQLADKVREVESWRDAYNLSEQAREGQRDLLNEAAEGSRTAIALLRAMRSAAGDTSPDA